MARKTGRQFFSNPGPTNIPESVLRAMARPAMDFNDPEFAPVYAEGVAGLRRILRMEAPGSELFFYTASGHGSWEGTLLNLLSPGDEVLVLESGAFSHGWGEMAAKLGLRPRTLAADWRRGIDLSAVEAALREDRAGSIKAVLAVHNETASGMTISIPGLRAAMDATRHGALLLVDTISSLGSLEFRMDDWGVDGAVGGSQKGLMLPVGFSFTAVSAKGMAAHREARLPRHYFDWAEMSKRAQRSFMGTVPVSMFYGLQESVRLMEAEGLDAVVARHARLAEAVRLAVRRWSGNAGPQLYGLDPARLSDSVTAVLMPEGHDAEALRRTALDRFNVSLGGGLGKLAGQVFRIGHLGDLNQPMVLGTLAGVEMSLAANGVPHAKGGVQAAMDFLAA